MSINRVYVEGDYIQFRDSASVFSAAIHYTEFSYFNDNGDILFLHRRDEATLYPITKVNFLDVRNAAGAPYVVAPQTLDDFLNAFLALLPAGGSSTAVDVGLIANGLGVDSGINQTASLVTRTSGSYVIPAGARKIDIICTVGTFTCGGATFPITTISGGKIDIYSASATAGRKLAATSYEVGVGSTVIEMVLLG